MVVLVPGLSDSAEFRSCTYGKCQEIGTVQILCFFLDRF